MMDRCRLRRLEEVEIKIALGLPDFFNSLASVAVFSKGSMVSGGAVVSQVSGSPTNSQGRGMTAAGGHLFLYNNWGNPISKHTLLGEWVASIGQDSSYRGVSGKGSNLFIRTSSSGIVQINPDTLAVVRTITPPMGVTHIYATASTIWGISNSGEGTIVGYDAASGASVFSHAFTSLTAEGYITPSSIAVTEDGTYAVVSALRKIWVFNLVEKTLVSYHLTSHSSYTVEVDGGGGQGASVMIGNIFYATTYGRNILRLPVDGSLENHYTIVSGDPLYWLYEQGYVTIFEMPGG